MKFNLLKKQQKQIKKKEKSRGRSMVEMLGVLAIIGVLSIGGIQGYTIAMRKHRANEVVNLAMQLVNIVYMNFYQYMINHPDSVRVNPSNGIYECKGANGSYDFNFCPVSLRSLRDFGLGNLPKGVEMYTERIYVGNNAHEKDRINVWMRFEDISLCKAVNNILEGYTTSSDAMDDKSGNYCDLNDGGVVDKEIYVGDSGENSYSNDSDSNDW